MNINQYMRRYRSMDRRERGMMIRVAIVDDERNAAEHLLALLNRYTSDYGVTFNATLFNDGIQFIEGYRANHFELVFMDVDMPDKDGFEIAKRMREMDSSAVLIYVTNIARFAIRGYEVNAMDYLLKPLSYEAFCLKIPKALAKCQRQQQIRVTIRTRNGQFMFPATSIAYVESDGHHITYHTESGEYSCYGTMKEIEDQLPKESFFRCNNGYIVNLAFVAGYDGVLLFITGAGSVEISRARRKAFLAALQNFYSFTGGR